MAEEVKKIITVEVGKSITSVRDFKRHIEDLRGALLGLNEESEEYKTIAEQIATDQAKLNEVMKVGKGNTDSAAGSYNELNNQLKALRQQYRALSETERNGATGQAILQNITKLDTELKDIDESMGQYYRNVGNYKGAFEEAFKAMAQNIGNVNPELGKLMRTASSLIPLIKSASKAATTGLKGIKASLASTGIGLLVVALGEIVAHWEEISNWVSKVIGKQKDLTQETKNTADAAKDYAKELEDAYDEYDRLWRRQGLNAEQRAQNAADIATSYRQINEAEIQRTQTYIEWLKRLEKQSKQLTKTKAHDAMIEFNQNLEKFEAGLDHQVNEQGEIIKRLNIGEQFVPTQVPAAVKRIIAEYEKDLELYKSRTQGLVDDEQKKLKALDSIKIDQIEALRKRGEDAAEAVKSEAQQLEDAYQKEVDTVINSELSLAEQQIIIENLTAEHNKKMAELRKRQWESSDTYKRLQEAKDLYNELLKYGKDEVELVQDKYERELDLLTQFGYDTTNLTNKYLDDIQAAIQNKSDDIDSMIEQIAEEIRQTWEKAFQVDLQKIEDAETAALHGADMMWTINPKNHESDVNLEREKEDRIYEIRKEGYQKRINLYQEHLLLLEAGSEEYLDMERQITHAKMDLDDLGYQHAVDLEERKRQDIQLTIDKVNEAVRIAQGSIQFYGGIANEIAAYTLETAKEGTAEYKAAQITQTIVSTLSGMVGSFSQAMSLYGPTPWGFALGAAGATAMGIIGALRVSQIKNANANSSIGSSSAGASAPGVGVEPLLNPDYDLQRMTNLSLQSDAFLPGKTQVYVLESDIQEVGNRVQVRENNATF